MSKHKGHPVADLYPAALGAAVKARRTQLGLTQQDLARRCDLDQGYLGRVEGGSQNVAVSNIARIAIALETAPEQLLNRASKIICEQMRSQRQTSA